ncbi:MAG: patatin-like phospholipase family protein [Oscillospiraceae bacterium]
MIKRGLVLGGGGSRGSYQVGVWKALKELNISIDIVTGTSIGALNGALIVQNDFQGCVDLWDNIKYESVLSSIKEEDFKTYSGTRQAFLNFIRGVVAEGGLDIAPLETTVREMLDEDLIRNSKINFGLVTVEYPSMKEVVLEKSQIPQGKMADYLLASAACYPAFKSRDIDNTKYVDGGYKNNLPIDMAIEMGANEVIAVDLEAIGNYVASSYRDVPVRYIKSYWNLGLFLSFDKDRIKRNMQLGYFDLMRSYRMIEGTAYAFQIGEKEKLFQNTLVFQKALNELFGFSILDDAKSPIDRLLRSRIIKALNSKPKARANIREYAMRVVELAAENMDISPTKIYTVNEISNEIIKAYDEGSYISFKDIEQSLKEPKTITKLRTIIENYEKKEVISFIYKNLQRIFQQKEVDNNIKLLAVVATKEFLSAMYIFALKNKNDIQRIADGKIKLK